jgi:hypothetical protein
MHERDLIIVDGRQETLRAFVAGFLAGRAVDSGAVVYGNTLPLAHGSLGERLRAHLPGGHHEALLLVDAGLARPLASALAAAGLRVAEHVRLVAASFTFAAETPSREAAAHIHGLISRPGPGIALVDEEREEVDPEAHGVDLYAPAHEYTFRARGRLTGALDGVVAIHRELSNTDFVTVEPIRLEERPLEGS